MLQCAQRAFAALLREAFEGAELLQCGSLHLSIILLLAVPSQLSLFLPSVYKNRVPSHVLNPGCVFLSYIFLKRSYIQEMAQRLSPSLQQCLSWVSSALGSVEKGLGVNPSSLGRGSLQVGFYFLNLKEILFNF